MKPSTPSSLLNAFQGMRISPATPLRPILTPKTTALFITPPPIRHARPFSATAPASGNWLEPSPLLRKRKMQKGRPRVPTGGSSKGTTVVWGDYGIRMRDHHRRVSAKQLKLAEDTIKQRLRGERYRLYKRVTCNVGVYTSGNEVGLDSPWLVLRPFSDSAAGAYGKKGKAHLTTGRQELPSTRSSSSSEGTCTSRSFEMPSAWQATRCPVCRDKPFPAPISLSLTST